VALEEVEFFPVESTNVDQIGYDDDDMSLYIRFINGALYVYEGVPPDVWEQLLYTPSKGKFIHTDLKNIYPYARVE